MDLVSVYMPTKDRIGELQRAVDSVLGQTYDNFELIVVNDGSSDGTRDYLDRLAVCDSRVQVIHHDSPRGAPKSRNEAILLSKGRFVTGLDDDDEFTKCRIETFVSYWNLLERAGETPSCIYSQDLISRGAGVSVVSRKPGGARAEDLFTHNCVGNQIFAPRENYLMAGLFDETLPAWQDLEFFLRVLSLEGGGRLLDVATYIFDDTVRPDRISKKSRDKIMRAYSAVALKHASTNPRRRQALRLQVFSEFYGFRPTLSDWRDFFRDGIWVKGAAKMLRAQIRGSDR